MNREATAIDRWTAVATLAWVIAAVVGCGDGGSGLSDNGSPPTPTPTPVYQPAKATISCFTVDRTPAGPCPTRTPPPSQD